MVYVCFHLGAHHNCEYMIGSKVFDVGESPEKYGVKST
jgi:hypothetical protein